MNKIKVIHIIPTLGSGGAESMLYKLSKNIDKTKFEFEIITLVGGGFYQEKINRQGIQIHSLNLKRHPFKSVIDLIKIIKKGDIIHSWMYQSNIIAFLLGKIILKKKVIWGIRRSYIEPKLMNKNTYKIARVSSAISKYVDGIISCTYKGKKSHEDIGYKNDNFTVIPNGFDMSTFSYFDRDYNFSKEIIFINIARWEKLKDHNSLLSALEGIKKKGVKFKLKLIGKNIDNNNKTLKSLILKYNLGNEIVLLGEIEDINKELQESHIYISSSISEGFPNVIGEAMATGLLCIATDAGDSKYILGDERFIVPIISSCEIEKKIVEIINLSRYEKKEISKKNHMYIKNNYSIKEITKQYQEYYLKVLE